MIIGNLLSTLLNILGFNQLTVTKTYLILSNWRSQHSNFKGSTPKIAFHSHDYYYHRIRNVPLALGLGQGGEFLQPLSIVVFSGLILATLY